MQSGLRRGRAPSVGVVTSGDADPDELENVAAEPDARVAAGTYGYSVQSGRAIPHDRLEAIPWATLLVEEKRGGIGSW